MVSQPVKIIPRQLVKKIEDMVYEKNGHKFIDLGSYCLDFKQRYAFLGFTKSNSKVILGDIYLIGPGQLKYTRKFAKVESRILEKVDNTTVKQFNLSVDAYRYSETIMEIIQ